MKNYVISVVCLLVLFSCQKEKKVEKEPFEMYKASELTIMMEQMYVHHNSLKEQILDGSSLSEMPYDLQQLHTAEMTDRFERDDNFDKYAEVFKNYQKELYTTQPDSLKLVYNNTINTCVSCHETSCTGPIPRIKKLLIE